LQLQLGALDTSPDFLIVDGWERERLIGTRQLSLAEAFERAGRGRIVTVTIDYHKALIERARLTTRSYERVFNIVKLPTAAFR